jgi:MFS-type transporter involved in bile tolerance (Atg22 family)
MEMDGQFQEGSPILRKRFAQLCRLFMCVPMLLLWWVNSSTLAPKIGFGIAMGANGFCMHLYNPY